VGVDLWAGDEVHFQQFGSRCRMWIAPEVVDPMVWHHPTRKSVGYFGAVRLRDGKLVYQRQPQKQKFNGETCFAFLKHLKQCASRSGRRVVVIVDNATYHHARLHKPWRDLHAAHFQLYFLPPYSPELNPIERVWKLTRRKCLHNQHFSTLDQVVETVEQQFQLWGKANSTLTTLCAIT
jgi:transposase